MIQVDLNSDLGESFGSYKIGMDEAVLPLVSSANIACGFHAGDPAVMQKTVKLALASGTAIGAHPGLPDLVGFGRRKMEVSPEDVYAMVVYQVGALAAFVKAAGGRLQHVKPHGALFNMAAKDARLADAIAAAVHAVDDRLILYGLSGSELVKAAGRAGIRSASEVFADRSYQPDGSLTPRSQAGAMIEDEEASIAQVLSMVVKHEVRALSGEIISVRADTLCIHGDGPKALAFSQRIRAALAEAGVAIRASGEFIR